MTHVLDQDPPPLPGTCQGCGRRVFWHPEQRNGAWMNPDGTKHRCVK